MVVKQKFSSVKVRAHPIRVHPVLSVVESFPAIREIRVSIRGFPLDLRFGGNLEFRHKNLWTPIGRMTFIC